MVSCFSFKNSASRLAILLLVAASTVRAGVVETLDPSDAVSYNTIGPLPTWNGNGDRADATFTLKVDFDAKPGGDSEVLWETGGAGTGSSLVYAASNTLRFVSRRGLVDTQVDYQLTPDQIAAGEIFVSWIFDLGNDEMRIATSHVGGTDFVQDVASVAYTSVDWSGNGAAGFGVRGGGLGGYAIAPANQPFSSGTINTAEGLRFYAGDAYAPSPVPEPMGALALAGAVALVGLQRRRILR